MAIGSHVDLAPTIADLTGLPPSPWQGRSLFDPARAPRAYFYVAEDRFSLGVREDNWKYIFDLREGTEQLYDLDRDPTEQHNLAAENPSGARGFGSGSRRGPRRTGASTRIGRARKLTTSVIGTCSFATSNSSESITLVEKPAPRTGSARGKLQLRGLVGSLRRPVAC